MKELLMQGASQTTSSALTADEVRALMVWSTENPGAARAAVEASKKPILTPEEKKVEDYRNGVEYLASIPPSERSPCIFPYPEDENLREIVTRAIMRFNGEKRSFNWPDLEDWGDGRCSERIKERNLNYARWVIVGDAFIVENIKSEVDTEDKIRAIFSFSYPHVSNHLLELMDGQKRKLPRSGWEILTDSFRKIFPKRTSK